MKHPPLICDTSGLLAALDRRDADHEASRLVLEEHPGPFVLSPLVLAELDHLVRRRLGADVARTLAWDVAQGAYELASLSPADVATCVELDERHADLGLGLADASLVVLAHRWDTRSLLTLDARHLRAVLPLQGGTFALLPADR